MNFWSRWSYCTYRGYHLLYVQWISLFTLWLNPSKMTLWACQPSQPSHNPHLNLNQWGSIWLYPPEPLTIHPHFIATTTLTTMTQRQPCHNPCHATAPDKTCPNLSESGALHFSILEGNCHEFKLRISLFWTFSLLSINEPLDFAVPLTPMAFF